MIFQTVFYLKSTGQIINVIPDRYVRSKVEKGKLCPGHDPEEVCFRYFKSSMPVDPLQHHAVSTDPGKPAVIAVDSGVPLTLAHWRGQFMEAMTKFRTIVVDMCDGLGDNLFRAASVSAAMRKYPEIAFFCKVDPAYRPVMAMCPDIVLFDGYEAHGLDPSQCGELRLNGGHMWDSRGAGYSKSAHYGLFFDMPHVAYDTRLVLTVGFSDDFGKFSKRIGLKQDTENVVMQLRTKDTPDRGWSIAAVVELASLIKKRGPANIFYLGDPMDMPQDHPVLINLTGKTTWLETIYILSRADRIFCIDSAVLHLCRALDLPYYCLWGHTDPERTLGVPAGPQDIGSNFGTPDSLMSNITPSQVMARAFSAGKE